MRLKILQMGQSAFDSKSHDATGMQKASQQGDYNSRPHHHGRLKNDIWLEPEGGWRIQFLRIRFCFLLPCRQLFLCCRISLSVRGKKMMCNEYPTHLQDYSSTILFSRPRIHDSCHLLEARILICESIILSGFPKNIVLHSCLSFDCF